MSPNGILLQVNSMLYKFYLNKKKSEGEVGRKQSQSHPMTRIFCLLLAPYVMGFFLSSPNTWCCFVYEDVSAVRLNPVSLVLACHLAHSGCSVNVAMNEWLSGWMQLTIRQAPTSRMGRGYWFGIASWGQLNCLSAEEKVDCESEFVVIS